MVWWRKASLALRHAPASAGPIQVHVQSLHRVVRGENLCRHTRQTHTTHTADTRGRHARSVVNQKTSTGLRAGTGVTRDSTSEAPMGRTHRVDTAPGENCLMYVVRWVTWARPTRICSRTVSPACSAVTPNVPRCWHSRNSVGRGGHSGCAYPVCTSTAGMGAYARDKQAIRRWIHQVRLQQSYRCMRTSSSQQAPYGKGGGCT
jgi:hypothetical protein